MILALLINPSILVVRDVILSTIVWIMVIFRRSRQIKTVSTCGASSYMSLITGLTRDSLREARIKRVGLAVARLVATAAPIPDLLVPVMRSWKEYKEIISLGLLDGV